MNSDTKHVLYRDNIRYSRHSDRGFQILKAEYERYIHHMVRLITTSCVVCACGVTLLSAQSFA
jgi:hypothetical protein